MGRDKEHIPYPQGTHTVAVTDIMVPPSTDGVLFRLYYPTEDCDVKDRQSQWPKWSPKAQYLDSYNATVYSKMLDFVSGNLKVPVIWNGEIMKDSQFPVIIFSHGLGGNRTCYSYVCTDLASHGFIVAAIEHRDGSASTTYYVDNVRGGRGRSSQQDKEDKDKDEDVDEVAQLIEKWIPFKPIPKDHSQEFSVRHRQVRQRCGESVRVLEVLERMNLGQHVDNVIDNSFKAKHFKNTMDLSSLAVVGHSFGAATVLQVLATDKRFKVGIAMDCWMFPLESDIASKVDQPLLMINSEDFHWPENIQAMATLDTGGEERKMITIRGTNHQNQTDFAFLVGGMMGRMCKAHGSLDPFVAIDINNQSIIAFLCIHLDLGRIPVYENTLFIGSDHLIHGTNVKLDKKSPRKSWSPFKKSPSKDKKKSPKKVYSSDADGDADVGTSRVHRDDADISDNRVGASGGAGGGASGGASGGAGGGAGGGTSDGAGGTGTGGSVDTVV